MALIHGGTEQPDGTDTQWHRLIHSGTQPDGTDTQWHRASQVMRVS